MGKICPQLHIFDSNSFRVNKNRKWRWIFDRCKFPIGSRFAFDRLRKQHLCFDWKGQIARVSFRQLRSEVVKITVMAEPGFELQSRVEPENNGSCSMGRGECRL